MIKRRYRFFAAVILSFALLIAGASPVLAESDYEGVDAIAITVIVPPLTERPAFVTNARRLFPVNVAEGYNYEGVRELVRIYELLPGESPEWINTDSFTRNGYYYQIAEITRRVGVAHTVREHTEIVEIPSATNNLATVIAGLNPTMEFIDEDGYAGVLHLDIRSIAMTQDGTRSTSRTVSQTREFPHLSNPDMALIPLTINVSGRTYSLADVDWRTNTANPIDFNSVAQTFTAFATYTRTATSTVSTGYTTIAEYSGILTRVASGDVRFVATFIGTPIVSPVINRPAVNPDVEAAPCEVATGEADYAEQKPPTLCEPLNGNGGNGDANGYNGDTNGSTYEPSISESETVDEPSENENGGDFPFWILLLAIPVALIIFALLMLMLGYKKKADALAHQEYDDSADALYSRMARIVKRDRKELAKHAAYEDEDEPNDLGEGEDLEGFVTGFENFDEDGDD